jgi:hypothetical protein
MNAEDGPRRAPLPGTPGGVAREPSGSAALSFQLASLPMGSRGAGVAPPQPPPQQPWAVPKHQESFVPSGEYVSAGVPFWAAIPPEPPMAGSLTWWAPDASTATAPPFALRTGAYANLQGYPVPSVAVEPAGWYWPPPPPPPPPPPLSEAGFPGGAPDWEEEERRVVAFALLGLRDGAAVSTELAWTAAALLPRSAYSSTRMQHRQSRRRLREAQRLYRGDAPLFGVPYGLPGVFWHASAPDASDTAADDHGIDDADGNAAATETRKCPAPAETAQLKILWREEANRRTMPGRGFLTVFRILGGQGEFLRLFEDIPDWAVTDEAPGSRDVSEPPEPDERETYPVPEAGVPPPPVPKSGAGGRRRVPNPAPSGTAPAAVRGRGGNLERLLGPGTDVAFRVKDEEGEWNWILGTVCSYLPEERKYRIADRGEEMVEAFEQRGEELSQPKHRLDSGKYRLYQVARSRVRPLPSAAAANLRLRPSMKVLALYPGTSALYPATVVESAETVMQETDAPHGMAYKLIFENEDEEEGSESEHSGEELGSRDLMEAVPYKYVHARFVLPLL